MTDQAAVKATTTKGPKLPRKAHKPERLKPGTLPPYINLSAALKLATEVYNQGGGRANADLMSKLTGNSNSSSSYTKKVNALKVYGLATEQGNDVVLTEAGSTVAAPTSAESAAAAKKEAFLKIGTFSTLYERYKGKLLPDDPFLKNIMAQDLSIPRDFVNVWMDAFKDAIQAVGLASRRPDGKTQILEGATSTPTAAQSPKPELESPPPSIRPPATVFGGGNGDKHTLPIPLGLGRVAQIELPTDFKNEELPRLLKMIALALGEGEYDVTVKKVAGNPAEQDS